MTIPFPWKEFFELLRDGLRQLAHVRKWVLIATSGLVILASGLWCYYWIRSTRYEQVIGAILQRECMPTPQIYKGLEAFVVSSMDDNVDHELAQSDLNPEFVQELQKFPKSLNSLDSANPPMPKLQVVPRNNGGIVLTDKVEGVEGTFLFLPIQVLRPSFTADQRDLLSVPGESKDQRQLIDKTIETDTELRKDIAFTAVLAPQLTAIANMPVTTNKYHVPKQVYLITKNGLNRIINKSAAGISAYQFPETTFFPSRPYFSPAFDRTTRHFANKLEEIAPKNTDKLGDVFYVSKPYIDLGGNGLVVTIARGILVDGYPRAVLCIDLEVRAGKSLSELVRKRVESLGGYWMEVTCNVSNSPNCNPPDSRSKDDPLLKDMTDALKWRMSDNSRADILGNIIVLHPANDARSDVIEASIPQAVVEKDQENFLLVSMNLVGFRRRTTYLAIGAASCFGLATLLLAYFVGVESKRSQDYRAAFAKVANVMTESPTPYVRLDASDAIRDFSGSFLQLMGRSVNDVGSVSGTKFSSLLADDQSQKTYNDVEKRRRTGEHVEPYNVRLRGAGDEPIDVKIVSAAIPDAKGGELPETFGLLLTLSAERMVSRPLVDAVQRFRAEQLESHGKRSNRS